MDNKQFIEQIRDLVAEGETEKSLDELYKFVKETDNELLDRLILLRNRMKKLQRDIQTGTMDDETGFQERAKINEAVLLYLRQISPEYLSLSDNDAFSRSVSESTNPPRGNKMNVVYIAAGAGLVLLLVIVMLLMRGSGDTGQAAAPYITPSNLTNSNPNTISKSAIVATEHGSDLRMRTRPDENSNILVTVPNGSKLQIVGADETYTTISNGQRGKWLKVEYNNGQGKSYVGWAWGGYLKMTN